MARGLDDDEASRELYSIPLSSSWFQWDRIDEVERRELPEFFDGSSPTRNPRVYKEYRDFIINKYREDVSRRLKFTEIRKSLIGDVSALHRVFLFLDNWGLINFSANPEEKIGGGDDGVDTVRVVIEEALPPGLQVVPTPLAAAAVKGGGGGGCIGSGGSWLPPLTSYSDVFGEWAPEKGAVCISCGGYGRSGSIKGNFFTCQKCLDNNNTKDSRSKDEPKSDVQIEDNVDHASAAWTDTETLLLLEAVLKHGDDWDLIAQHVRTKNKLDCIARLIQLPFGDYSLGVANGYCGDKTSNSQGRPIIEHKNDKVTQESIQTHVEQENDAHEKPEEESQPSRLSKRSRVSCLTDMTSSLMRQVALLSTVTGPYVASAAADAAVTTICTEIPSAKAAFETDENKNIESFAANNDKANDRDIEEMELQACDLAATDQPDSAPEKNFTAMAFQIRAATATALGSVAARAKLLAEQEDREIEHQMATIIEMQLRKIKYKMKHFEEPTSIMEKEYECIQQQKELIISEWVCVLQRAFKAGIPRWRDIDYPKSFLLSIL